MTLSKNAKIVISFLILSLAFLFLTQLAWAEGGDLKTDNYGLNKTAEEGFGKDITKKTNLPLIIGQIVGTGLSFLGVVFFVLILYAGLTWILSMGKEDKINQAKEMITAAVLGLIVVLGAYAITNLTAKIFSETTGVK